MQDDDDVDRQSQSDNGSLGTPINMGGQLTERRKQRRIRYALKIVF